jgi:hypothetical protein
MADDGCGEHCPFLNRSDRRCSEFLSLDRIAHAFDYCFGEYKTCPMYLELLTERRVRRICGNLSPATAAMDQNAGSPHAAAAGRPVVQLTVTGVKGASRAVPSPSVANRFAQSAAAA